MPKNPVTSTPETVYSIGEIGGILVALSVALIFVSWVVFTASILSRQVREGKIVALPIMLTPCILIILGFILIAISRG